MMCAMLESNDMNNRVLRKRRGGVFVGDWFQGLGM